MQPGGAASGGRASAAVEGAIASARANLQTILDNLTAGVAVDLDER